MRPALAILFAGLLGFAGVSSDAGVAAAAVDRPNALRIGLALQPTNALVIVALSRGYFEDQGLRVVATEYPSGTIALETGLFAGKVDLITASDAPIALAAFKRRDFKVIATVYAVDSQNRVIARKDRGIASPRDLRGKRVATQSASAVHFFLSLFLASHGITERQVEVTFMAAESLPRALADGAIDAFAMREPYLSQAKSLVGDKAVVFAAPGLYDQTDQVVVSDAFLRSRPDAVSGILRALVRAEEFARSDPARAHGIVAQRLGTTQARIAANWPNRPPRVSLEQSLLSRLEAQARWAIRGNLVSGAVVPNYLDVIHLQSLAAVRPRAVTMVR